MRGNLILDLQFGSTGKGLIAGFLAERDKPDTIVTAWAANAGHTYIDADGNKFIHTMLANGIVSPNLKRVLIGPGSLIDPAALRREINEAGMKLMRARGAPVEFDILIHPHAAIITQEHRDLEAGPMTKIGSTKKGVGEAAIQRIRRDPMSSNTAGHYYGRSAPSLHDPKDAGNWDVHPLLIEHDLARFVVSVAQYNEALDAADVLQVEGAQGYSLSMYHGMYPYVTSRDVSTHQILADCGIPAKMGRQLRVVGCVRTFPIRVANRYDEDGKQVGWSGPCYDDQREVQWSELGREPELTTVTKLPRRIFTWSNQQVMEAIRICGVDDLFVNFVNYLQGPHATLAWLHGLNDSLLGLRNAPRLSYIGAGPTAGDIWDCSIPGTCPPTMDWLEPYWRGRDKP